MESHQTHNDGDEAQAPESDKKTPAILRNFRRFLSASIVPTDKKEVKDACDRALKGTQEESK